MLIPEGARNIRVSEVAEATNYLAVANSDGQFYLNGDWFIQWNGDYQAAGTVIHYQRDGNKESINATGPLKEPLKIMVRNINNQLFLLTQAQLSSCNN